MDDNKMLTPSEYFEQIKSLKNKNTDEELDKFYESALLLLQKYKLTKQKRMIKKLMFVINCIPKERELLKLGIDTFVYKDDIEEYINSVESKAVKIIELENFPGEIPEELLPVVESTEKIFDNFFVLFTDYNGKEEKRVAKERRDKDPILFGVFIKNSELNDRFYYLGDWVDPYCDLTLEKLVAEKGSDIIKTIRTPINKEELLEDCSKLVESNNSSITTNYVITNTDNKSISFGRTTEKGFFSKIKSVFGKEG